MNATQGIVLKGIADFLVRLSGLITFPILAYYVGSDGYGAFNQLNTIIGFIIPFASLGLGESMIRYFSIDDWSKKLRNRILKVILYAFISTTMISFIFAVAAPLINSAFLKWAQGTELFRWGAFLIILGALELILFNVLRSRQFIITNSVIQLFQTLLVITATVFFIPRFGLIGLLQVTVVIKLITIVSIMLGFWTWVKPKSEGLIKKEVRFIELLKFGMPMSVIGMGLSLMHIGDRFVIGYYLTASDIGLYGAAYSLAGILAAINTALNYLFYPRLVKSISLNEDMEAVSIVRVFHKYSTLLLVPSAVYLLIFMQQILFTLGGSEFKGDILFYFLLITPMFIEQWNTSAHYILASKNRVMFCQNAWLVMGVLNVVGNIFITKYWGLKGAALVTFVTFIALDTLFYFEASKYIKLRKSYRFGLTAKALISSSIAAVACIGLLALIANSALGLLLSTVAFGGIYFFIMFLIKGIEKSDALDLSKRILNFKRASAKV